MNVASLDLCKELYELSGWLETSYTYKHEEEGWIVSQLFTNVATKWRIPAYDLGYLLRKLPAEIDNDTLQLHKYADNDWFAAYWNIDDYKFGQEPVTSPEDAVCKLAIELFKQGLLNQGGIYE